MNTATCPELLLCRHAVSLGFGDDERQNEPQWLVDIMALTVSYPLTDVDMAAQHRARFRNIQIVKIHEISDEECKRPYILQILVRIGESRFVKGGLGGPFDSAAADVSMLCSTGSRTQVPAASQTLPP